MAFLSSNIMTRFRKFLGHFYERKENDVGETPEVYLQLTTKCLEQARKVSPGSLKFNRGQCNYLVKKLKVSVQSARSFLEPKNFDDANLAHYREVFKFLYSLSKEVESFINTCYRNEWIEAAVSMMNVDKHVSSIGFNLEVFAIVFADGFKLLTLARVTRISKAEVETVEKEAFRDKLELCKNLKSFIGSSKTSQRWDLAHFLLERLERSSAPILPPESSSSNLREGYFTGLKRGIQLGCGGFAVVYQSEWLGVSVAEKVFPGQDDDDFKQECSIYLKLSHPNILCLFGYSVEKVTCSLVLERMDNDLLSLIWVRANRGPSFTSLEVIDIMHQIAEGVFYLHENKVVHRDLKSKNILYKCVKTSNQMETAIRVKVADFGLSKIKEKSRTLSNQTPNTGTDRWMAPEVILILNQDNHTMISESEEKYPFKCDVYSFAMVCYELLTGLQPFHSITLPRIVKQKVLDGERPKLPDHCPDLLRTLIEKCWSQDPKARPDFGDICEELRYLKCLLINDAALLPSSAAMVVDLKSVEFSYQELAEATNDFSLSHMIGEGGFASVYYSVIRNQKLVIKKMNLQATKEFLAELEVLTNVHHTNLVQLIGYCTTNSLFLVLEYIENGTLDHHLRHRHSEDVPPLSWMQRVQISLDAARGLEYIHEYTKPTYIHRDIKPANILIDSNFRAKVADFGLAKRTLQVADFGLAKRTKQGTGTEIVGTFGYMSPEYALYGEVSPKLDVYAFGVVLFEIISGRLPISGAMQTSDDSSTPIQRREGRTLSSLFEPILNDPDGKSLLPKCIDPALKMDYPIDAVWKMAQLARRCTHETPEARPTMRFAVVQLMTLASTTQEWYVDYVSRRSSMSTLESG